MDKDTVMLYVPENIANQQLPDEELLAFYQDLENRVLWIDDEISDLSLLYVKNILRWNKLSRENQLNYYFIPLAAI